MELIASLIAAAISILLYLLIYNKLSEISRKLTSQENYYKKLVEDQQLERENERYRKAFDKTENNKD